VTGCTQGVIVTGSPDTMTYWLNRNSYRIPICYQILEITL
jgi:hypothetical protein